MKVLFLYLIKISK